MHSDNVIVLKQPDGPRWCRSLRTYDRTSMTTTSDFESCVAPDQFLERPCDLTDSQSEFDGMVGSSAAFRGVLDQIRSGTH